MQNSSPSEPGQDLLTVAPRRCPSCVVGLDFGCVTGGTAVLEGLRHGVLEVFIGVTSVCCVCSSEQPPKAQR